MLARNRLGFGFLGLLPRGLVIAAAGLWFILFATCPEGTSSVIYKSCLLVNIPVSETLGTILESSPICRMTQLSFQGVRKLPPLKTNLWGFHNFLIPWWFFLEFLWFRTGLSSKEKVFLIIHRHQNYYRDSHGGRKLLIELLHVPSLPYHLR